MKTTGILIIAAVALSGFAQGPVACADSTALILMNADLKKKPSKQPDLRKQAIEICTWVATAQVRCDQVRYDELLIDLKLLDPRVRGGVRRENESLLNQAVSTVRNKIDHLGDFESGGRKYNISPELQVNFSGSVEKALVVGATAF